MRTKLLGLLLLACLFWPAPSSAAIARDATSTSGLLFCGGVSTFSHTVSGSDRLLLVVVFGDDANNDNVTGVTYNSVSMTRLVASNPVGSGVRKVFIYGLVAPDTGTNDVDVSCTSYGGGQVSGGVAASYTGVVSTAVSAPDATGTGSVTGGTDASVTLTAGTNAWMFVGINTAGPTVSAGTGSTEIQSWTVNDTMAIYDSNGTVSGSNTMHVTLASSGDGWGGGVTFCPTGGCGAAAAPAPRMMLMGVGQR